MMPPAERTPLAFERCLNCGADLRGSFCAACGQRSVPANPTVMELVGDAWQELSGYDGRVAASVRGLIEPGRLTVDYINGRRARYLSPVKLYLTVSVIYFLIAAAAPKISTRTDGAVTGPGGLRIEGIGDQLTAEERADLQKQIAASPWFIRPMFESIVADANAFQARVVTLAVYFLRSLRAVFGGGWVTTVMKAAAIGIVYLIASIPAFTIILIWASLT